MTVTIAFADSTDGYVVSNSNNYTITRTTGANLAPFDGAPNIIVGQSWDGAQYAIHEGFARWTFAPPAGEVVTGAAFRLQQNTTNGPGVTRDLELRQYAYPTPLSTAAWRDGSMLGSLPLLATVQNVQSANGKIYLAGSAALMNLLATNPATVSTVITSSRTRTGNVPTGFEQVYVTASEGAGTVNDPALIFTSAARSTLFGVMAGQVRLSDGSWAVLESDGAATPAVTLKRHTGAAATTVGVLPAAYAAPMGGQGIALVADPADNLYVIGRASGTDNALAVVKYAKGSGWTWVAGTAVTSALPAYGAQINQVAASWTGDGIFVAAGHAPGSGISGATGNDLSYAVISASTLAATTTNAAPGNLLPQPAPPAGYYATLTNETGSGLDVAAGYLMSVGKDATPGDSVAVGVGRYEVAGGALSGIAYRVAGSSFARKDAGAKTRLVVTGTSTVAVVTADPDAGWGITVVPYQASASGWTALSQAITLDGQGITGMPAASALASSPAWDVVYLPRDNKLWIYFPDATDGRIIRRTGVNLTTYQATKESVTVSTVGAAGATNLALRVARNGSITSGALVTVASKASGGALSTVYVLDPYNVAPTAPTLTPRTNYDASSAATFAWTFNDPNLPSDGQTAYQLQIINAGTSAVVVDTGKVVSSAQSRSVAGGTLANGVTYQWRVMTWDQGDLASPWSPYASFSTGAGGSVTITSPATDNPPGAITDDYVITWSVTGTTQTAYKIVVVRVDTGATLSDTGWVNSTATSATVSGLLTDVQYEVRVTVRNASAVESSVGIRRITPSYGTPDKPTISVECVIEGGYVLVTVDNPPPTGDRPVPVTNRVWRRVAESGDAYTVVGEVVAGDPFRDYTAASGVAYEYQGEAVAP